MGLPGNGTIPAVYSERIGLAKLTGMQIMELVKKDIKPRNIMVKEAFLNALTIDMALGCSTNDTLHLPAIAHECEIELNLDIINDISDNTPNLCHLAPAGEHYIEELNEAGGISAVMHEINKLSLLNTELITCTGKKVSENIAGCQRKNTDIVRTITNPYSKFGEIAVLKGHLAPDGGLNMSKMKRFLCNRTFQIFVSMAAIMTSRCYLYWHHAQEMPDCMKDSIESDE